MKPLISVIIPIYNASSSIGRCVNSVLEQTFTDFELILVDDGSTDDSLFVCQNIALQDKRVVIIHQANQGVSSARNYGIILSRGVWMTFVDADDYLNPQYLEKMLASSANNNDIIVGGYNKIVTSENKSRVCLEFPNVQLIKKNPESKLWDKLLLYGMPWGKLFRTSLIKINSIFFPIDFSLHEDHIFFFEVLLCSETVGFIDYCGYNYVDNGGVTLSRGSLVSFELKWKSFLILSQKFKEIVEKYDLDEDALLSFQNFRVRLYISAILLCYKNKSYHNNWIYPTKELRKQIKRFHKPVSMQGYVTKIILVYFPYYMQRLIFKLLIR